MRSLRYNLGNKTEKNYISSYIAWKLNSKRENNTKTSQNIYGILQKNPSSGIIISYFYKATKNKKKYPNPVPSSHSSAASAMDLLYKQ